MLSPKNHIRGKNMHAATAAGAGGADLQPNKKAGVKPAFRFGLLKAKISTSR
jgi:hypothetical protein